MTKPSRAVSNGTRGLSRLVVILGGQGAGGGKAAEADPVDGRLCAPADNDIGFARADQTGCVADRLDAGGAGRNRRTDRAFVTMADRYPAGRQIAEKGRDGKGRQAPHTAGFGRAHGVGDNGKAADAGGDDRRRSCGLGLIRQPAGLGDRFRSGRQGELDKAIHLLLVLGRDKTVDIEAAGLTGRRHLAGNMGGTVDIGTFR